MRRLAFAGCALVACFGIGLGTCAAVVAAATGGGTTTSSTATTGTATTGTATTGTATTGTATTGTATNGAAPQTPATTIGVGALSGSYRGTPAVPPAWEAIERGAATTCPGLTWSLLGAIGRVESDSGRSTLPGVSSGENADGAEGPMQFEVSTFAQYAVVGPGGATPPSPYDPVDAVYTAAHLLCANGAGKPGGMYDAVWDYNHTTVYVEIVLVLSHALAADPDLESTAATAIAFAASKLGVPYVWGGTGPDGYDCSGLTQAAYAAAGIEIPRTSTAQWTTLPHVRLADIEPGDLVFFEPGEFSPGLPGHVGIYIGDDDMVDAPHTGTDVQIDDLAGWPSPMGAARPSELAVRS